MLALDEAGKQTHGANSISSQCLKGAIASCGRRYNGAAWPGTSCRGLRFARFLKTEGSNKRVETPENFESHLEFALLYCCLHQLEALSVGSSGAPLLLRTLVAALSKVEDGLVEGNQETAAILHP